MSWLLLVLVNVLTGSLARIFQKILLKNKESDPFAFSFIFQLIVAFLFLIHTLIYQQLNFPNLYGLSLNILIMSLFYSLGNIFTFKAFKLTEASEVAVIFSSNTLWSVLAAIILLGEELSTNKISGISLVIIGLIAINYRKTDWKINKGHAYALLGAFLFGVAFTNDALILNRFKNVSSYMTIAFLLPGITTLFFKPKAINNLPYFLHFKIIPSLLFCCFLYFLASLTIFEAYKSGGNASIISPISQSSLVLTVIISYIFLKERDHLLNKIVGTLITFTGILLLI